ncbi:MAG: hypothetical protein Q8P79_00125 [Nanoarchaeota archaeon]|nr:hypothetical protein [Nanoarchaeota archaeon]
MNSQLTPQQLKDLRGSLKSSRLENAVKVIYSVGRNPRPLYGNNGVMLRTVGENFAGPLSFQRTYYDDFRGKEVMTEFAEFVEAKEHYDKSKTRNNLIELVLEAGDILFQEVVLEERHREHERYKEARKTLNEALNYVKKELNKRGIELRVVKRLAQVKYGVRTWMIRKKLPTKNPDLEKQLCLEEF